MPRRPFKKGGGEAPRPSENGYRGPRGRPDLQNDRFPILKKFQISSQSAAAAVPGWGACHSPTPAPLTWRFPFPGAPVWWAATTEDPAPARPLPLAFIHDSADRLRTSALGIASEHVVQHIRGCTLGGPMKFLTFLRVGNWLSGGSGGPRGPRRPSKKVGARPPGPSELATEAPGVAQTPQMTDFRSLKNFKFPPKVQPLQFRGPLKDPGPARVSRPSGTGVGAVARTTLTRPGTTVPEPPGSSPGSF